MSLGAKSSAMCPRHQALIVRISYAIGPSASTEILSFYHRYSRVWLTAARKCALTPQSRADGPRAAAPRKGLVGGPPLISDVKQQQIAGTMAYDEKKIEMAVLAL